MLNQLAFPLYPDTKIGDTITFSVHGIIYSKKLVGIVRETASPAAVYVTNALFNILIGTENSTTALKIALNTKDPALRGKIIATIERTLENNGINVTLLFSGSELKTAMAEHMAVLIYLLLGLSMIMAFVGVLGLSAAMGTTVVERTREFGILKSIGARPFTIISIVLIEGVFISIVSIVFAVILSAPFSLGIGSAVGYIAFKTPLPLAITFHGMLIWTILVISGPAISSFIPAYKAGRISIRESLSYL